MERRYLHAENDAPLYRVPVGLGGRAWPAYRVYDDKVILDVNDALVAFQESDVALIARPASLPDWAVELLRKVMAYEAKHGCEADGPWACFGREIEAIPRDVLDYVEATGGK